MQKKVFREKVTISQNKIREQRGFVRVVIGAPFFKWTGFRLLLPPFSGKMSGFYFSRPSGNRFTAVISDVTFDRQRFPARCNWRRQFSEERGRANVVCGYFGKNLVNSVRVQENRSKHHPISLPIKTGSIFLEDRPPKYQNRNNTYSTFTRYLFHGGDTPPFPPF